MIFFCLDLETTGLNPNTCDILEVGIVIRNTLEPDWRTEDFQCYVKGRKYGFEAPEFKGEAYALSMHSKIFRRIAEEESPFQYVGRECLARTIARYIEAMSEQLGIKDKVVMSGKNFATFDLRFLEKLPDSEKLIKLFHRRILDPGGMLTRPEDLVPPDLKECMRRTGIEGREVPHTACEDADLCADVIVRAIRGEVINGLRKTDDSVAPPGSTATDRGL
jgi:DNA polymerase III epsilon subunit-like protein